METIKINCLLFIFFLISNSFCEIYYDSYGKKIELPKTPEKIIAIGPGAARLISYLGKTEKLIATENIEIKYPQGRPYNAAYREIFKKLPIISEGGPDKIPDYEKILMLRPDLIVLCSADFALSSSISAKTGIPVFNADYGNLGTFELEKFKKTLISLGKILAAEDRANFLLKRIDYYVSDLSKRSAGKLNPEIYVGGLGFKGSQGILSTQYLYEPFSLLGLKSVIDSQEKPLHIFIDKEKLAVLNPEYIFLDSGGLDAFIDDYNKSKNYYLTLKAFKKRNVYTTLPYNYYTTNVEIVFANAYFIGKILFPESFSDLNIDKKAAEIIKDFLGKDVYHYFTEEKRFYKRISQKDEIYFQRI
ncbi:MAG: ABC transporter substrate-binding protein [Elusimicrobia bacterium]|nr:ABC transporter substrate-binding protein [Elusimicrobiota bacterium]